MSIPKDGYYIADVQLDSGGLCPMYVHVNLGKPHDEWGGELLPEACSNFREVDATPMVRVWPQNAAMELKALRTANAGLVEKVRRLETVLRGILDNDGGGRVYSALALADFRDEAKRILEGQP